jgi:hypothetical protein
MHEMKFGVAALQIGVMRGDGGTPRVLHGKVTGSQGRIPSGRPFYRWGRTGIACRLPRSRPARRRTCPRHEVERTMLLLGRSKTIATALAGGLALLAIGISAAQADDWHGKGHGWGHDHGWKRGHDGPRVVVRNGYYYAPPPRVYYAPPPPDY